MSNKLSRRYLFIGGPARSGTTAFVRLMNRHPRIVLGIERYKFVYGRKPEGVGPELFESIRFLYPNSDETNIEQRRPGDINLLEMKLDRAVYLGDKVPHIMRYRSILTERFPGSRFIVLCRDVHRVCSSWNRRAEDPKDHWPAENNFKVAVEAINKELRAAVHFCKEEPSRCLIVRYENIFGANGVNTMVKILDWLRVKHHPRIMDAVRSNLSTSNKVMDKDLFELEGQRDFISTRIDWNVVKQAETLSV